MGDLTFKGLKVEEIDLTNKVQGEVQMDISQRATFNVKYTEDNRHCAANLIIDMMDKNAPMNFNFKVNVTAFLDCDEGMDQKEIHLLAYSEVYPHVRAIANAVFATAGLPPIVIPKIKMDPEKIKIGEDAEEKNGGTVFSS